MNTIETLLESLQANAPVIQVLVGAFWTAVVLDTDPPRCGLASTLRPATHPSGPPVPQAGRLLERSGRELAGLLHSSSTLEASIGMAAFNALLKPCPELAEGACPATASTRGGELAEGVNEAACTEVNAEEIILERGTGRRVAIVGHFPFVERVRRAAATCWVVELHPHPGDLPAEQATEVLPQADVVALTGTSLINHTFDALIGLCRPDAFVLLLGPSAPLSPVLFKTGVDAVSGTLVTDPERVLRSVSQGATFRQIKRAGGLRLLTCVKRET
ncbi:MAG: DUF364 domain-containing protein [Anaerolineae bacterium]